MLTIWQFDILIFILFTSMFCQIAVKNHHKLIFIKKETITRNIKEPLEKIKESTESDHVEMLHFITLLFE